MQAAWTTVMTENSAKQSTFDPNGQLRCLKQPIRREASYFYLGLHSRCVACYRKTFLA